MEQYIIVIIIRLKMKIIPREIKILICAYLDDPNDMCLFSTFCNFDYHAYRSLFLLRYPQYENDVRKIGGFNWVMLYTESLYIKKISNIDMLNETYIIDKVFYPSITIIRFLIKIGKIDIDKIVTYFGNHIGYSCVDPRWFILVTYLHNYLTPLLKNTSFSI